MLSGVSPCIKLLKNLPLLLAGEVQTGPVQKTGNGNTVPALYPAPAETW